MSYHLGRLLPQPSEEYLFYFFPSLPYQSEFYLWLIRQESKNNQGKNQDCSLLSQDWSRQVDYKWLRSKYARGAWLTLRTIWKIWLADTLPRSSLKTIIPRLVVSTIFANGTTLEKGEDFSFLSAIFAGLWFVEAFAIMATWCMTSPL